MAGQPDGPPSAPSRRPRRRLPRRARIGLGLVLTLAGIGFASVTLPTDPGALGRLLPWEAGALLTLWVGGILLGRAAAP